MRNKKKANDLDKLGTVLAVSNQIHKDMLAMLKEQQEVINAQQASTEQRQERLENMLERQQKRQWGIILFAIFIMAMSIWQTNNLIEHVDKGVEVLRSEHQQEASKGLSQ